VYYDKDWNPLPKDKFAAPPASGSVAVGAVSHPLAGGARELLFP
jgi:hypothetical protein